MDKKHCIGCRQNFYNGNNPYGIAECWSLQKARVITRFAISVHAPMGNRRNYFKEQRPQCYEAAGIVFLKAIPDYATAERARP